MRSPAAFPHLWPAVVACLLLTAAYFLVPVDAEAVGARVIVRALLTVVSLVVVTVLVARLVRRILISGSRAGAAGLLVALLGGVVLFAFVDFLVALRPGQFEGLETRIDALYFAVTTLATVGFGDVHATGQLARVVVTVQQLYNLAVIATGATVLVNRIVPRRPS